MPVAANPSKPATQGNNRDLGTFMILFFLAFLPYSNIFFNQFVYDDGFQLVGNPYSHSFKYLRQIFTTSVWSFQGAQGFANYYRPMMTLGYLLTYQIAGLVPFSFHMVNVMLNGIVVWLIFLILRQFSGERVALVAAGLFALHPIHTETVTWIAGVTDLELSVFYLAAFFSYLKLPDPNYKSWTPAAMCVCCALALLSKEQAMTLPVVAMIFEHFYRDDRSETSAKEKISRYGPLWVVAMIYLAVRVVVLGGFTSVLIRPNLSWYQATLTGVALLGKYLGKLVWPSRLSVFYVFQASQHLTDPKVLWSLAGLALCAILFAALWKRAHIMSFALLWLFLLLGPVLNSRWMPASVFGERYLYLPSLGFCWIVAWVAVQLWGGAVPAIPRFVTHTVPALLCVVALAYGVKTISRNRDWRSDESLYRSVIETQGDTSLIRANLGSVAFDRGDFELAERDWMDALAMAPSNIHALDSMALLRQIQRRYDESLDYSTMSLQIRPNDTFGHVVFGVTLAAVGRAADAEKQFRTATSLSPLSTNAHNAYGKFLLTQGRSEDARAEYERSVDADFNAAACDELGDIYLAWQDFPRAEKAYRRALAGNSFDSHAHFGLGKVLESTSRPGDALVEYENGLAMDPSDADAKSAANRLLAGASTQAGAH